MKALKNIAVGFGVSFVGSLPLGYLNVVGYHLLEEFGVENLLLYLTGVAIVEAVVIYFALVFARKLSQNKKLLKYIELFSIVFMFGLAVFFSIEALSQMNGRTQYVDSLDLYHPFIMGLMLSGLNFIQIPFWVGWNLYLVNGNYILTSGFLKAFFVAGAATGTFCGMLCFALLLNKLSDESGASAPTVIAWIIPGIFLGMAILSILSYFKKRQA